MSMLGKMSVGVRAIVSGPMPRIRSARTTKVYGLSSATRTIHIDAKNITVGPKECLIRSWAGNDYTRRQARPRVFRTYSRRHENTKTRKHETDLFRAFVASRLSQRRLYRKLTTV